MEHRVTDLDNGAMRKRVLLGRHADDSVDNTE